MIQGLFFWENSHMYQFSPKGYGSKPNIRYQFNDDIEDWYEFSPIHTFPWGEYYPSQKIKLSDYFHTEKQKIIYIYDFGDDWKHSIVLEKLDEEVLIKPVCMAGKGNAPVDDCGGMWGYYEMVEAINKKDHPSHADFLDWMGLEEGDTWDVHEFDLEETNNYLSDLWAAWQKQKNNI